MTSALRAVDDEMTDAPVSSSAQPTIEPRSGEVIASSAQTFHFSISFSGRIVS